MEEIFMSLITIGIFIFGFFLAERLGSSLDESRRERHRGPPREEPDCPAEIAERFFH